MRFSAALMFHPRLFDERSVCRGEAGKFPGAVCVSSLRTGSLLWGPARVRGAETCARRPYMRQSVPYMANTASQTVLTACRLWLKPVARWLLRSGITWKEFAELSRDAFVDTAFEDFGIRGRPTNVSRVALLTGLSRRDVRRVRERGDTRSSAPAEESLNHASRVLTGWHLDPDFLEPDGRPRVLPAAQGAVSFEVLLKRYAGDIPTTALVKELVKSGSIERLESGAYRVLRRYYMPRQMDGHAVERAGSVLADIATTVEHNLSRGPRDPSRFEGRAQSRHVDPRNLPAFRAFVEREAQGLLERVDDWLASHEAGATTDGAATVRLGVGVYQIQDEMTGDKP